MLDRSSASACRRDWCTMADVATKQTSAVGGAEDNDARKRGKSIGELREVGGMGVSTFGKDGLLRKGAGEMGGLGWSRIGLIDKMAASVCLITGKSRL